MDRANVQPLEHIRQQNRNPGARITSTGDESICDGGVISSRLARSRGR